MIRHLWARAAWGRIQLFPIAGCLITLGAWYAGSIMLQSGYRTFYGMYQYDRMFWPLICALMCACLGIRQCRRQHAHRAFMGLAWMSFLLAAFFLLMPLYAEACFEV